MFVVWAGPIVGIALPLLVWIIMQSPRAPGWFIALFIVGFCLIANGAYLAIGSFEGIGDAGDMLSLGSPQWLLITFGVVAAPCGLWLWHGLGKRFGFGREACDVPLRTTIIVTGLVIATILVEIALTR